MAGIGPILGLLIASAITYVMPKKYESRVVIELRQKSFGWWPRGEVSSFARYTDRFLQSESGKIKCRDSLSKVIDKLDLTKRWGVDREAGIRKLDGMVDTKGIEGANAIAIGVRSIDKVEARDIALEVARAYKDDRDDIEIRDGEIAMRELKKAVEEQENLVAQRRQALADMVREKGVWVQPGEAAKGEMDAKLDFEGEREMAEQMKLKLIGEEISAKMPFESVPCAMNR